MRTRLRKRFTETDTDERKRNPGNQAYHIEANISGPERQVNLGVISRGTRWKAGGRHGNVVYIAKVFKNALWTALRTIFRLKFTILQDFAYTISNFSGGDTPEPSRSVPDVRIQTPISVWFTSIHIVPVLRNDHCVNAVICRRNTVMTSEWLTRCTKPAPVNQTLMSVETSWHKRILLAVLSTLRYWSTSGIVISRRARVNRRPARITLNYSSKTAERTVWALYLLYTPVII